MIPVKPSEELALLVPVTWGNEIIDRLVIRRPKVKDLKRARDGDDMEQTISLLSHLTGHPPPFFDELDAADMMEAGEIVEGFLKKSPATGRNGSESSPVT